MRDGVSVRTEDKVRSEKRGRARRMKRRKALELTHH